MSGLSDQIWSALPQPALVLDAAGNVAEINPAGEDFLNLSRRALIGKSLMLKLEVEPALNEAVARVRAGQSGASLDATRIASVGRKAEACGLQIAPLGDASGHLLLLFERRSKGGPLDGTRGPQGAAKSAIGMAEMLAHEIKNPLAGISGAAQLVEMSLGAEDRELTGLILAETRRILKLIDQVEEFGNVLPPAREAVNVHDVLERARRSATLGFASHMQISEGYDPSLPATFADPDQLSQVFLNLLKNAAEAGAPGGQIRLKTYYDPGLRLRRADGSFAVLPLVVEIEDDGPGLPPEIADHVFDPFVSGRENGTGLGLALISKIITEHEGWIAVESEPGRTVFRISLPLAPAPTDLKSKES